MKSKKNEADNTSRAMAQLFKKGRVIVAHDNLVRVLSPKALASTTRNKRWMGGPVSILLHEDMTPYELSVVIGNLMELLEDLAEEDTWPDDDVFSV